MPKTPGKMHMYDMVKIDIIVFEIVGGGAFKAPPRIVSCLKLPGSDGVKSHFFYFDKELLRIFLYANLENTPGDMRMQSDL